MNVCPFINGIQCHFFLTRFVQNARMVPHSTAYVETVEALGRASRDCERQLYVPTGTALCSREHYPGNAATKSPAAEECFENRLFEMRQPVYDWYKARARTHSLACQHQPSSLHFIKAKVDGTAVSFPFSFFLSHAHLLFLSFIHTCAQTHTHILFLPFSPLAASRTRFPSFFISLSPASINLLPSQNFDY